ncbi:MAG: hypothetical protein WAM88_00585 [Nitrososphaeraceae archaeon]
MISRINEKQSMLIVHFVAMAFCMMSALLSPTTFSLFVSQQNAMAQQETLKTASIEIPLSKGYVDGKIAYFIATDASDEQAVKSIMNNTGFTINYAPILAQIPESQRGQGYLFLNGIKGEAPNGFQLPVANAVPGDEDYSPIWESNFVKWNDNATAKELKSVEEVLSAQNSGELTVTETDIIVNSPAVNYTSGS